MKKLLAALLVSIASLPAGAATIDFNGLAFQSSYNSALTTGGFNFSAQQYGYFYYGDPSFASNGTDTYIYSSGPMTITKVGGGAFTLNSMDLGAGVYSQPGAINYTLNLAAGGTATGTLDLTYSFQTFSFGQSVTSVVLSNLPINYAALDNFVHDEAAAVPEPAMLGLFGLGLVGLGLRRRRRAA